MHSTSRFRGYHAIHGHGKRHKKKRHSRARASKPLIYSENQPLDPEDKAAAEALLEQFYPGMKREVTSLPHAYFAQCLLYAASKKQNTLNLLPIEFVMDRTISKRLLF